LPRGGRIELGATPAHPGKRRETKVAVPEQGLPGDREWGRHRQLCARERGREAMLLADLRIAPARRAVELEHQLTLARADLVDTVFVAVEREQPPIGLEPEGRSGVQHHLGSQFRERLQVAAAGFVYHPCPMKHGTILVTGGAGYIGSHVVLQLRARGERVVILDDLSRGFRQAALDTPLVVGKVGDRDTVLRVLKEHGVDTVMHFAAYTIVPESVSEPLKYYGNNTCSTRSLLECCVEAGVRHFVFSSTAAVYGIPADGYAAEDTTTAPINPYGTSKLMSEWMLRDVAAASPMKYVALRYFNVAGSDTGCRVGQATPKATLLVKVACEAAVGKRTHVSIFGTDYPTPDGTGIRDYIHVEDLAT